MSKGKPIGLLGGAFDPVHRGHVRLARACMDALDLQEVHFIPANIPPHKIGPGAPQRHRLAMLERALTGYPQLLVNDVELKRGGISYTIDTLIDLRGRHPDRPLCFILGMDAFATLPEWRRWQELTDYAHLVVVARKSQGGRSLDARIQAFYVARACSSPATLHGRPGGFIHKAAVSVPDVSSSQLRAQLRNQQDAQDRLPPGVHDYIKENRLYL